LSVDVAIVGGGLSGLYTAVLLQQRGYSTAVLEARDRLGGRILSRSIGRDDGAVADDGRYDLGPAWLWPDLNPRMHRLVAELGLTVYPQATDGAVLIERSPSLPVHRVAAGYQSEPRSMRIRGGVHSVIEGLVRHLPSTAVRCAATVKRIEDDPPTRSIRLTVQGPNGSAEVRAQRVVLALPPRLIAATLAVDPPLPSAHSARLAAIPTWMAGHAKFMAVYARPFWREQGLSATAMSAVGPLAEIHDASVPEGAPALFGFLGLPATERATLTPGALESRCLEQLSRLFGSQAAYPSATFLMDWAREPYTATSADAVPPNGHPRYGSIPALGGVWADRLHLAGTELAPEFGGYLEGALEAAAAVVQAIAGQP
jgi:monoamine oxidase